MAPFTRTHKHIHTRMAHATAASHTRGFSARRRGVSRTFKWGGTGGTEKKAHRKPECLSQI